MSPAPASSHSRHLALITGTTAGIGSQLAELCAADGHDLILVARREALLRSQAEALASRYNITADVCVADLCNPAAPERIMKVVGVRPVDVLINNAGFNEAGPFLKTDLTRELGMVQTHLAAMVHLCKCVLPGMVERGQGRILNLGSTGSFTPGPGDAVYCAAKAFVLSFSEALATELKGTGVTVTTLCPGATRTEFAARAGIDDTVLFNVATMSPEAVARVGYRAMMRGRRVRVAGVINKAMVASAFVFPRPIRDWTFRLLLTKAPWTRRSAAMTPAGQ